MTIRSQRVRRIAAVAALLFAAPAAAQVPPAELGQRTVPAPWWMRDPVVIAIGAVRTELPANRAYFGARFAAVERTAAEATTAKLPSTRATSTRRCARSGPSACG